MLNLIIFGTVLFFNHSDSTLQLLGKALSYSFISSNTPDYDANSPHDNPYNTLRIGLHDKLINLTPLFTLRYILYSLLYSYSMWNIFFYISFYTSNYHTHHQTLQNNFN